MNLRPLGYEPPEPCLPLRISSHTSHPVAAYTAGPSHRVSGVPAHHTTSYYRFDYSPRLAHPRRTAAHGRGCLHCVDLRPTAELQHTTGDDAQGDTAPQTATFCVALSGETFPFVDEVVARERRVAGADRRPAVAALRPARSLLLRGRRSHRVSCGWKHACLPSPYQCRL